MIVRTLLFLYETMELLLSLHSFPLYSRQLIHPARFVPTVDFHRRRIDFPRLSPS